MQQEERPHNYVKVKTITDPPSLPIRRASEFVNRRTVFINTKISKGDLKFGYAFDPGIYEGQGDDTKPLKLVILDEAWEEFVEQCHAFDVKKGRANKLTLAEAAKEAGVPHKEITFAIRDNKVTIDDLTGKILKDDKWVQWKKDLH